MSYIKIFPFVLALALAAVACGETGTTNERAANANARPAATATPAAPTPTPDELAQARETFSQTCVRCHKEDGTGGTVELDDGEKLKVPSLREHGRKDSDEHLAEKIRDGGDGMPAFKDRLDAGKVEALVRFVRVEFHGRGAGAEANSNAAKKAR